MSAQENTTFFGFLGEIAYLVGYIVAVSIIIIAVDLNLLGHLWSGGDRPFLDVTHFTRILLSALLAGGVFLIFGRLNPKSGSQPLNNRLTADHDPWFLVSLSQKSRTIGILLVLVFALFYLAVFFVDPLQFRDNSSDQKMVENFSILFALIACGVFIQTGRVHRKAVKAGKAALFYPLLSWFFALLFFWIAMEEMSWGQGILHYQTPEFFMDNSQQDVNLHNYATYTFELAYYFGSFLFFIVLPFLYDRRPRLGRTPVIAHFLPSRFMIYIGAMAAACNYDMWDNMFFQIGFFLTVVILIYYSWINPVDNHRFLITILILVMIATQISYILWGHLAIRRPVFKEYKEFYIPLTFMYYSFEVLVRAKILAKAGRAAVA